MIYIHICRTLTVPVYDSSINMETLQSELTMTLLLNGKSDLLSQSTFVSALDSKDSHVRYYTNIIFLNTMIRYSQGTFCTSFLGYDSPHVCCITKRWVISTAVTAIRSEPRCKLTIQSSFGAWLDCSPSLSLHWQCCHNWGISCHHLFIASCTIWIENYANDILIIPSSFTSIQMFMLRCHLRNYAYMAH